MNIEQEKMIVESLPSLYPMMQRFEEDAIKVVLDALPRWIPCSKRLPEKEGLYLVTEIYKYSDGRKEYEVNVDRWSRNGSGREWSMCSNDMIFAWMPLPEPYKGVTE